MERISNNEIYPKILEDKGKEIILCHLDKREKKIKLIIDFCPTFYFKRL